MSSPSHHSNFIQRSLSALVLAPVVLCAVYIGGVFYAGVLALVFCMGAAEWIHITARKESLNAKAMVFAAFLAALTMGFAEVCVMTSALARGSLSSSLNDPAVLTILSFAPIPAAAVVCICLLLIALQSGARALWIALGVPYLAVAAWALLGMRWLPENGRNETFYLLGVVWGTDIGAYLAGRLIGGPKLMPSISPNKTWAGLIGGMALAAIVGYGVASRFGVNMVYGAATFAAMIAVVAQMGDLFESWIKRRFGVKDSGHLIPGHGGVLDRIDGLLFAAVFYAVLSGFWGALE